MLVEAFQLTVLRHPETDGNFTRYISAIEITKVPTVTAALPMIWATSWFGPPP